MVEVFGSTQWKLYEIVWSHVIHNFIGQINSNKGRFDRKSIKRDELSFRIHRPHFSLLSRALKTFLGIFFSFFSDTLVAILRAHDLAKLPSLDRVKKTVVQVAVLG